MAYCLPKLTARLTIHCAKETAVCTPGHGLRATDKALSGQGSSCAARRLWQPTLADDLHLLLCGNQPSDRRLASLHFKMALALQFMDEPEDGLTHCQEALKLMESKLEELKNLGAPSLQLHLVRAGVA